MPFLLMVFLTLVCLPEPRQWPEPALGGTPGQSAALTWAVVALVAAGAWAAARRVRVPLGREPGLRERVLHRYERERFFHRLALFGAYGLSLEVLGWGHAVGELWRWPDGSLLPCAELVVLAPFLAGLLAAWFIFYDADRALHLAAQRLFDLDPQARSWLEGQGASPPPSPAPPFGGRAAYVFFQFRQKLALVFIPLGLLVVQKDLRRQYPDSWAEWEPWVNAAGLLVVTLVLVGLPWVFRLSLGLRPVPPGPLRDRLMAAAARLRFRCSDVLLWNTRSGMANAMVIGLMPWPRYVVFTDRLLEDFSPEEVEAVFGHEMGHVKHYHMLYYFGFLSCSMLTLWFGWQALSRLPGLSGLSDFFAGLHQQDLAEGLSIVAVLLGYIFVVFGFLSRRCERQADVFGCRAVSCGRSGCAGHGPGEAPAAGGGLCATGIRTFIRALDKVALVNGISRDRPGFLQSWQHSTIARRVDFLQRLLEDPSLEPQFQRRVAWVKAGLLAVVVGVLAALAVA
jgi:Zn-dependent protease with chaperone function